MLLCIQLVCSIIRRRLPPSVRRIGVSRPLIAAEPGGIPMTTVRRGARVRDAVETIK